MLVVDVFSASIPLTVRFTPQLPVMTGLLLRNSIDITIIWIYTKQYGFWIMVT